MNADTFDVRVDYDQDIYLECRTCHNQIQSTTTTPTLADLIDGAAAHQCRGAA